MCIDRYPGLIEVLFTKFLAELRGVRNLIEETKYWSCSFGRENAFALAYIMGYASNDTFTSYVYCFTK